MHLQRRMQISRRLLNRLARQHRLGSLTPFVHFVLEGVPMAKPALAQTADVRPKTGIVPKLVTAAKVAATVAAFDEVGAKIAQLKGKQDILKAELLALHQKHGVKFETADFFATEVPGTNSYIDRARLVKAGVKASIIEACTVKTKYTYPKVTRKKTDPTFEVSP